MHLNICSTGLEKSACPHLMQKKNLFVAFLGINQVRRVGLRFVCWFYDGNTQRLTESGFMERPGFEPATPGLQDIGLSPTPRQLLSAPNAWVKVQNFQNPELLKSNLKTCSMPSNILVFR